MPSEDSDQIVNVQADLNHCWVHISEENSVEIDQILNVKLHDLKGCPKLTFCVHPSIVSENV